MIIYEVRCVVAAGRVDDFQAWIGPHMDEVVANPGFVDAAATRLDDEAGGAVVFVCRYRVEDRSSLDVYLAGPAQALRADGVARFGDALSATRTIGEVVAESRG